MNDAIRMQISAFVDGELPDNEADLLLRRMSQDATLRRKAAEYLEIGRAMRGETGVPGVDRLVERVMAGIDDKPLEPIAEASSDTRSRAIRPLLGAAVAASVALVAIFGLQLQPGTEVPVTAPASVVQDTVSPVPEPYDSESFQYLLSHGATATEHGANGMNLRLITLRLSEEVLPASETEDDPPGEEDADDLPTTQP